MTLTRDQLAMIMPLATQALLDRYYQPIVDRTSASQINTALRLAHFLAQIGNETGDLHAVEENLNYSAQGLIDTWPTLFNVQNAAAYAHQPEKIANRAYGGRYGNGPEASGDGWKFRGRGMIQLTFKSNYIAYGAHCHLDFVTDPNYDKIAADPNLSVDVACWFWMAHNLNAIADRDDCIGITRVINGGLIGLPQRQARLTTAKRALGIITG
jgi:putative chitinase